MEYKIVAFSTWWSTKRQTERATLKSNELAGEGWSLIKMEQGWNAFAAPTIYLAFERERK